MPAPAKTIPHGTIHKTPPDLRKALMAAHGARMTWNDITPLARNEWICWITSAKKDETREKRIKWGIENLSDGKRRPCSWAGCPHR